MEEGGPTIRKIKSACGHALPSLVVLFTMLAGGAGEARAQAVNLYKNVQDDFVDSTFVGDIVGLTTRRQIAMAFTTGDNAGGYTLSAVKIWVHFYNKTDNADPPVPGGMPKVSIYTNSSGSPGTSKYPLTTPMIPYDPPYDDFGGYAPGYDFTAPPDATLDASTTYFVVFEDTGTDGFWRLALQHLTNKLETVAAGWSAGTQYLRKDGTGTWGDTGLARKIYMKLTGTIDAEADTTAPTLSTATVDGTSLELTYDETLDGNSRPAPGDYTVNVDGSPVTVSSVAISGSTVTLTLGTAVTSGQTVTVTYGVPSSNPVQDTTGNDSAALMNQSVTNNTNAPEFVSANVTTTGAFLTIVFDAQLSSVLPPLSAFTVTADGETAALGESMPISVQGAAVRLTMKSLISEGQTVTVSYADPTPGSDDITAIQDVSGIDAVSFADEPVTNNSTAQLGVPSPPTNLTVTVNADNKFELSWVAPVDNGGRIIVGYWIEWSADWDLIGASAVWQDVSANTGSQQTRHIHTPGAGVTRSYRVSAINSEGTGPVSNVDTVTSRTENLSPSAPRRLMASATQRQIDLSWEPPGYEGEAPNAITGYKIERSADGATNWTDLVPDTEDTATTYADKTPNPGTEWHYRVSAINSVGAGQTATVSATTLNLNTPTVPLNLRAIPSPTHITLRWDPPADDGGFIIRGYEYRLIYKIGPPGGWVLALLVHDLSIYEHVVRELHLGQTYTIEFRAYNENGPGEDIDVTVTTRVPATSGPSQEERETPTTDIAPANIPPVMAIPLADQTATVGVSFTYVIPEDAFTDADGDPLAYAAATSNGAGLPGWLTFNAATRTFTGTPDPGDVGTVNVTVTASDGMAAASDEFALTTVLAVSPSTLQAWTSRFGRTVATHVTDAVGERLRASPGQNSHVTVGGYRLPVGQHAPGDPESAAEANPDPLVSLLTGLAGMVLGPGATRVDAGGTGTDPWAAQPEADPRLGAFQAQGLPTVRLRDVLLGSSFRLTLGAADDAGTRPRLTAWGRVAGTTFDGRDGDLSLDGNVLTGTLGVDGAWDRWLAGVAVSHSLGGGAFSGDGAGDLDRSTLTSLHPYLRYAVNERVEVWSVLGYGWGALTLEPGTGGTLETDTTLLMGSFGGRGILLAAVDNAGYQLATRTDAMLTRTTSEAVAGLAAGDAEAHRLRLVLEGTRDVTWPEGQRLTPTVEVGVRHDWGDAETGFGLELGGRVRYADPTLGLTIEAAVRGLLAHEDRDYQEWGASGALRIDPGPTGQGLSLTLAPTWGAASSGLESLWSRQTTAGLAPQGTRQAPTGRLNAEVRYGIPAPLDTGLLTPYAGTVLAEGAARTYRLGTRWITVSGLTLTLEGTRQEPVGQQSVNQGLQLQIGWGF